MNQVQDLQDAVEHFINNRTMDVVIEGNEDTDFLKNKELVSSLINELLSSINDEQKKLLLQLEDAMCLSNTFHQAYCYKRGFKDAIKLLVDTDHLD